VNELLVSNGPIITLIMNQSQAIGLASFSGCDILIYYLFNFFIMKKQIFKPVTVLSTFAFAVILTGAGCASTTVPASEIKAESNNQAPEASVKEFVITSFYEMKDGKPAPQYSMKEIKVKKGDKVRIKVTNTKGGHDFKIDELEVYADTPLDQEVVIEFTADQTGSFVYYCTKPGHRQNGHWGTLIVE
jgi:FtsP/CotA-like multicopper oxidase with cupredoxin domain